MRCGITRGVTLSCALTALLAAGDFESARADWFHHTIPRETPALDYRTGDVMRAPPIPYGEYVKDYPGAVHGAAGMAAGLLHGAKGKLAGLCGLCGGEGCGHCGGHGLGHGDGCDTCGSGGGHGHGHGHGNGLLGHGRGLFGGHGGGKHGLGLFSGHGGKGLGHGIGHGGAGHGHAGALCGPGMPCASGQSAPVASAQGPVMPSGQSVACGGCKGLGKLGNGPCGLCGGRGLLGSLCGGCKGSGHLAGGNPCGSCGGRGLLACLGKLCGLCGGKGCGSGNLCGNCGGKGCGMCGGTGLIHALAGLPHHLLGSAHSAVGMILHKGDIDYFVGPGGPVPLTPGYVPYIVPTRSPRDYFAFPPFTEQTQP